MDKYKKNISALDNLRLFNKRISNVEITLKKKYLRNQREYKDIQQMLENSIEKYHSIMKNLDNLIF